MATQTEHYGLAAGVVSDDFVQPDHQNKVAETLDRVVGNVVKQLISAGVYNGWLIQEDKTVSAGEGLVQGCWCGTSSDQAITGLQNDAVNYVFAVANDQSPDKGAVGFSAQLTAEGPNGAVCLGTIELDSGGGVVEIDNTTAADRSCFPLLTATVSGSGEIAEVPGGGQASFEIDHEEAVSFLIPGAIEFKVVGDDFEIKLSKTYQKAQFEVVATNSSSYPRDLVYTWQRWGIAE